MSAQHLSNAWPNSAQCPQFLLNVPYICLMFLISAQCLICLPNVVRGQISDFFRYVLTKNDDFYLKPDSTTRSIW